VEPAFLSLNEVIAIHREQIKVYDGSPGVRDWGLLKSAIAMPAATFGGQFLHCDLYEMAAAYLFRIVQNHPFIDGNKRVGAMAADVFLLLNAIQLTATHDVYADIVLSVARGECSKSTVADFLRVNSKNVKLLRGAS
jgi:death-on-curing protein